MRKKVSMLMLLLVGIVLPAAAQITIITSEDIRKSEPIDEVVFRVQYELKMIEDSTKINTQPNVETMMLEVGKRSSLFYSYTAYLRDSVLAVDVKNRASQDAMLAHSKAYGNARVSYKIYKNYPTGKVTTLDRLATTSFRCEEEYELPQWTLQSDTVTILTYACHKAICHFRGRTYTAWYTLDIPVSEGPWKLSGLPGLVIKAEDSRGHYSFLCTGVEKSKDGTQILFNKKGYESISRKDLNRIYERYAKDPMGFIASTAPNITITMEDEQGNVIKKPVFPYNPIELSER